MKRIYQIIFFISLLFCIALSIAAQKKEEVVSPRQTSEFPDVKPDTCAFANAKIAGLAQYTPKDKTFIVIARLGNKDFKPNLSKRRLHNVRAYLTQAAGERFNRDPQTIILAEGEPVKDYGRVEVYVDGKLVEVFIARRNSDLNIEDCYGGSDGEPPCVDDWQKLFYPCKDRVGKQKQKRKVVPKKKKARQ